MIKKSCSSLFIKCLCPSTRYYFVSFLKNIERHGLFLWKKKLFNFLFSVFSPISIYVEVYPNIS